MTHHQNNNNDKTIFIYFHPNGQNINASATKVSYIECFQLTGIYALKELFSDMIYCFLFGISSISEASLKQFSTYQFPVWKKTLKTTNKKEASN